MKSETPAPPRNRGFFKTNLLILTKKVDFFDDIEKCLGTSSFICYVFGCIMSWLNQIFIISRAKEEQVGIKLFFRIDIELVYQGA